MICKESCRSRRRPDNFLCVVERELRGFFGVLLNFYLTESRLRLKLQSKHGILGTGVADECGDTTYEKGCDKT